MSNTKLNKRLPQHKAPDNAWQHIESQLGILDGNSNTNIELRQMHAPDTLWNKLNTQLDALDNNTSNELITHKLPVYTYESKLALLNHSKTTKQWIHIAASIFILASISTGILFKTLQSKETITYSITEVIIDNTNYDLPENMLNSGFEHLLNQFCSEKPQICQNQDYQMLNKQLEQIKAEEQNLKTIQEQYKDPNLNKMILQLQNDKAQIEKYLLMLF